VLWTEGRVNEASLALRQGWWGPGCWEGVVCCSAYGSDVLQVCRSERRGRKTPGAQSDPTVQVSPTPAAMLTVGQLGARVERPAPYELPQDMLVVAWARGLHSSHLQDSRHGC